jgi:organic radical activating enzyme
MKKLFKYNQRVYDAKDALGETKCSAKYYQATLHLQNGTIHMCHHPKLHKIEAEKAEKNPYYLFNTNYLKKRRMEMQNGIQTEECDYCWRVEKTGCISDRFLKSATLGYKDILSDNQNIPLKDYLPKSLEVSFSNVCNMKCSYCKAEDSSMWQKEVQQYGTYPGRAPIEYETIPHNQYNPYLESFKKLWPELKTKLETFRITGGEPLLDKNMWYFLDDLIANPNPKLVISINSNLSVSSELVDKLIDYINELHGKVKEIKIYTSIDTINKEQGEYIRYGMDYNLFFSNFKKLHDSVKNRITIVNMCTVSNLSVIGLSGVIGYFDSLYQENKHNISISLPYIRSPSWMHVSVGGDIIIPYIEQIKSIHPWVYQNLNLILQQAKIIPSPREFTLFKNYWTEYDKRRGTNFVKTFPELKHLMD